MNHKRRRPKHQRAGCLYCKGYKDERVGGIKENTPTVQRQLQEEDHSENITMDSAKEEAEFQAEEERRFLFDEDDYE